MGVELDFVLVHVSLLTWFWCSGIKTLLLYSGDRNRLNFTARIEIEFIFESDLKILGFSVWIEINLVFVWRHRIDLLSEVASKLT